MTYRIVLDKRATNVWIPFIKKHVILQIARAFIHKQSNKKLSVLSACSYFSCYSKESACGKLRTTMSVCWNVNIYQRTIHQVGDLAKKIGGGEWCQ